MFQETFRTYPHPLACRDLYLIILEWGLAISIILSFLDHPNVQSELNTSMNKGATVSCLKLTVCLVITNLVITTKIRSNAKLVQCFLTDLFLMRTKGKKLLSCLILFFSML